MMVVGGSSYSIRCCIGRGGNSAGALSSTVISDSRSAGRSAGHYGLILFLLRVVVLLCRGAVVVISGSGGIFGGRFENGE